MTSNQSKSTSLAAASPDRAVPIAPLVRSLVGKFDAAGLSWVVLRNAEGLPEHTDNDIDLLVARRDFSAAKAAIRSTATEHAWEVLCEVNKPGYHCCWLQASASPTVFLQFDLISGLSYHGCPYADARIALRQRSRNERGIWVTPSGFQAATTLIKELIHTGRIREEKRQRLRTLAMEEPTAFTQTIERVVGPAQAAALLEALIRSDWEAVESSASALRRGVLRPGPRTAARMIAYAFRVFPSPGYRDVSAFVVFVGPDGSGKTTVADQLVDRVSSLPCRGAFYLKSHFGVFPQLKRVKVLLGRLVGRRVTLPPEPVPGTRHIGMHQTNPWWRSLIYVLYYALDTCLGRLKLARMRRQGALIVFDRYFYDYYYQRGNRNIPSWYLNLCGRLVPTPDLLIYLDRDAEEIYARKPELTIEEIKRQQDVIRRMLSRHSSACIIDAREGIDRTVTRVIDEVVAYLSQRNRSRRR